jgi:hypothetical protein
VAKISRKSKIHPVPDIFREKSRRSTAPRKSFRLKEGAWVLRDSP